MALSVRKRRPPSATRAKTFFIPIKGTKDAADGDLVLVQLKGKRQFGA